MSASADARSRPPSVCALGLMSGTSYDAVDVAVMETDGEGVIRRGPSAVMAFHDQERALIGAAMEAAPAWDFEGDPPPIFGAAQIAVTAAHARAVAAFLAEHPDWEPSLIGFHGQTVLHRPPQNRPGATCQLGDGQALADLVGLPVVFDFRRADIAAGGHGAPLAPIYHWALAQGASGDAAKTAVLNLGGVANITFLTRHCADLLAFDTGPANGMLDAWVSRHGAGDYDTEGRFAAAGTANTAALARLLDHRHFDAPPPKSLDRFAFSMAPLDGLSLEDGCATLTAFTAETVARALRFAPQPVARVIVAGGGVRNPVLRQAIAERLDGGVRLEPAAALGWDADALEAELMAYLAMRSLKRLPLSFPGTTGVAQPQTGGRLARPRGA